MQRTARLAILGIALVAGLLAAYLMYSTPEPQVRVVESPSAPTPQRPALEVLTAIGDLPVGTIIKPEQFDWRPWPAESPSQHLIRRAATPNAKADLVNSIVRVAFLDGEPIRADKLIKPDGSSGFMSAILPAGMRAMAITIDSRGANAAGGFIFPNDRVDVVRTFRNDAASKQASMEIYETETILSNVRVLAIGQKAEENANGERTVSGETATLELDPQQVETIALAQRQGTIALALRSMVDRKEPPGALREKESALSVVRYGVSNQAGK